MTLDDVIAALKEAVAESWDERDSADYRMGLFRETIHRVLPELRHAARSQAEVDYAFSQAIELARSEEAAK